MKRQIMYFLFSLLIAFLIWTYVVTTVSPESERTFTNITVGWDADAEAILKDKGLMVVRGDMPTVTIKVRGNRSDLNNLSKSDIDVIVDLDDVKTAGKQELDYTVEFAGTNFEIASYLPEKVTLEIAEWATKEVAVRVITEGEVAEGYQLREDQLMPNPSVITITGPKSVVDQVTQAVFTVDVAGKTEGFTETGLVSLRDRNGEAVDSSTITADGEVRLAVRIARYLDVPLHITPIYGDGVTAENSYYICEPQYIRVVGSDAALAELQDGLNLGEVDFSKLDASGTVPILITEGMLKGAEIYEGSEEVNVMVVLPGRITRELIISRDQIEMTGLPAGMNLNLITENLTVTLTGRQDQVEAITAEDLTVTVDLSGASVGDDQNFEAVVTISSKYPNVTATVSGEVVVDIMETVRENRGQE